MTGTDDEDDDGSVGAGIGHAVGATEPDRRTEATIRAAPVGSSAYVARTSTPSVGNAVVRLPSAPTPSTVTAGSPFGPADSGPNVIPATEAASRGSTC